MAMKPLVTPLGAVEIVRLNASISDLAGVPEDGYRYEMLGGVLFRMPPPQEEHGQISSLLIEALAPYCRTQGIRSYLVTDIGYELTGGGNLPTVLAPDVSIFRQPKARGVTYNPQAPRLAVEIASPSQTRLYLQDKAHLYLAAGTSLVWVVWPDSHTIDVWTPPAQSVTLGLHDDLDGGVVFPGLVIPVAAIFP